LLGWKFWASLPGRKEPTETTDKGRELRQGKGCVNVAKKKGVLIVSYALLLKKKKALGAGEGEREEKSLLITASKGSRKDLSLYLVSAKRNLRVFFGGEQGGGERGGLFSMNRSGRETAEQSIFEGNVVRKEPRPRLEGGGGGFPQSGAAEKKKILLAFLLLKGERERKSNWGEKENLRPIG